MAKFEVTLEGVFTKEYYVDANNKKEAEQLAKSLFDKDVQLCNEDFIIDTVTVDSETE
ncbi:MAG: hypothetical protein MJZ37_00410 [Bacilli bacterium]|nr:hypothetical protein [Bacilli bacterium]